MNEEENTQLNTGTADVGGAWIIALVMLLVLITLSLA